MAERHFAADHLLPVEDPVDRVSEDDQLHVGERERRVPDGGAGRLLRQGSQIGGRVATERRRAGTDDLDGHTEP